MILDIVINYLLSYQFIGSLVVIFVCLLVYFIAKNILSKTLEIRIQRGSRVTKKKITYIKRIRSILKYTLVIIAIILILQLNGVNVSSFVAGLGVASIIAGLALQDALKDIISGFNLIMDNYFSVGDVVRINNVDGEVVDMQLKTTKFRDVRTGDIFVISNRNISEALVLSTQVDLDVPLPYESSEQEARKLLEDALAEIAKNPEITQTEYKGIAEFGSSATIYRVRFHADPKRIPQLSRDARGVIKSKIEAAGLEIPYNQLVIHSFKK